MREILFREKNVDNGAWVYGSFIPDMLEVFCITDIDGFIKPFSLNKEELTEVRVERSTVGQFTGLTDKNGTKIFEGDIIKIIDGEKIFIASVKFGDYNQPDKILKTHIGFYFDIANLASYRKDMGYWFGKTFSEIEVIGNIHDNPELLK